MIRTAYKQAEYGCAEISVRQEVRDRFKDQLDSWFQQSAVKYGIGMFKSDHATNRSGRIFGGKGNLIPIAASTEIAQRGYRLVILKNKQFYPKLPAVSYLEDLWKETKIPLVETWKEQHSWVKNSKLKYRVPVPDESVFRIFQSPASLVGVL
jgi:hypothetical protein